MLLISVLLACHRDAPGSETGGKELPQPEDATVHFNDVHNYSFEGVLNAPRLPLVAYEEGVRTDMAIAWDALNADLQCHDLDPVADIDNASLMIFPYLSADEVEEGLAVDSLQQVDMGIYLSHEPGDTTEVTLSQLTFFGTAANIQTEFVPDNGTWLFLLSTGTGVGTGSRMMAFLEPTVGGPASTSVEDGCAILDYSVELETLTPLPVPLDGPWVVDWSGVNATGHGSPLIATRVTSVRLARFEGMSLPHLEDNFLDLEYLAADQWSVPHPGGRVDDLAGLINDNDGSAFTGFDTESVWLLALMCESCPVPAPLALTVLAPG